MTVVIDYEAGNIRSVETALSYIGERHVVSDDPKVVASAAKIVFPGVGDGAHAMEVLHDRGLDQAIRSADDAGVPILGICVGCQVVFDMTEEHDTKCLGLVPGAAVRFPDRPGIKVPHMGWNQVHYTPDHWLFHDIPQNSSFYFVHSFYPSPANDSAAIATTDYEMKFVSAIERDNLVAVQFHPEKSGEVGLQLLRNFLGWR